MPQVHDEDPYDLQRFVDAQASVFDEALEELRSGSKKSHWMWFIFPQIKGLASSPLATRYAISSRDEAAAYLDHPILGPRLAQCCGTVTQVEGRSINQIFGYPDDLKFHSSITLFAHATGYEAKGVNPVFKDAVDKYFAGKWDPATLARL